MMEGELRQCRAEWDEAGQRKQGNVRLDNSSKSKGDKQRIAM